MKFVLLKSHGGDYLVVVSNVAYLRKDENGQTKIGLIGGFDPRRRKYGRNRRSH
ncbi:MAG: hypothetical protein IPF48_02450 [Sphingomonadales bacterium]|nr:hypothetical protein [Sphingomonadales bacterium]